MAHVQGSDRRLTAYSYANEMVAYRFRETNLVMWQCGDHATPWPLEPHAEAHPEAPTEAHTEATPQRTTLRPTPRLAAMNSDKAAPVSRPSLATINEEMEKVARSVHIPTTPELPLEYARGRIKVLCLQNGINLQQEGCTDIWEYCHNKRQLGHGPGKWWPKGPEAWMYAQCSAYVECWLWGEACGSWETGQPLSHPAYGTWWPVLVGLPCPPPDDDRFAYVCPALAARSCKCWWGHRSRLVLAAYRGPPPPPQRPPPCLPAPPLSTLPHSGSGSAAPTTYVPSSAAPSEVSTAVPSTAEPSSGGRVDPGRADLQEMD